MSTFTTLNGTSPKQSEATTILSSANDDQSTPSRLPHSNIPRSHQQQQSPSSHSHSQAQAPEPRRETWEAPADRAYQPTSYPEVVEGTHKRKRSNSPDGRRELPPPPPSQSAPSAHSPAPEVSVCAQNLPALAREAYTTPQSEYAADGWRCYQSRESQGAPQTSTEDVDALRRATIQGGDQSDYAQISPDGDDRSVYPYTPDGSRRESTMPGDQKKRKRNFSNRTKTGCLTCRRRKKKCDEQKPECSNCIKGGFLCAGYQPQRGPVWSKSESKAPAILEPKDNAYMSPSAPGSYVHPPYPNPISGTKRDQHHYRGQPLRIDPPQGRPILTGDDRPTATALASATVASPETKLTAMSAYPGSGNVFPTPISANPGPALTSFSDRTIDQHYGRVPSLHEVSRNNPEPPSQPEAPPHSSGKTLPQINILNPTRSNSPVVTAQVSQMAQMALNQFPSQGRSRTQKDEMLIGRQYYPYDRELQDERDRCSMACWRFNNMSMPQNGISSQERQRLFREILQPAAHGPNMQPNRAPDNIVVEAPFNCDYGYNVTIGQHVLISKDCSLQDAAPIKIGDNCHIGPNVKFYTDDMSPDPKQRGGVNNAMHIAKPITIEADCFIGGNVTILPGVTIGKGSTVGAGSVVTRNVPPMTVATGNPARVIRGSSK